jgi:hypothetical protein
MIIGDLGSVVVSQILNVTVNLRSV